MSRVQPIVRSPVKKMRFPAKDEPAGEQRGMMPWQITEYRQVYCLDRMPDGQLPSTVSRCVFLCRLDGILIAFGWLRLSISM